MAGVLRAIGIIVALAGGAALFTSLVGPLYPLMASSAPSLERVWRRARRWGVVLVSAGLAMLLLSFL